MRCAIGKDEANRRAWHSIRVTVATALSTRRHPDGLIQALVCWKTLDAMRLYAKTNRHQYADAVEEVTQTDINVTQVRSICDIGPEDVVAKLNTALDALDAPDSDVNGGSSAVAAQRHRSADATKTAPVAEKTKGRAKGRAAGMQRAAPEAPKPAASPSKETLADGTTVQTRTDSIVGHTVKVPNTFWAWGDGHTWCTIVARCVAPYVFADGSRATAYVISDGARADAIKGSAVRSLSRRDANNKPIQKASHRRARG